MYLHDTNKRKPRKAPVARGSMLGTSEVWPMRVKARVGFEEMAKEGEAHIREYNQEHPDEAIELGQEEEEFSMLERQNQLMEESYKQAMKAYEEANRTKEKKKGVQRILGKVLSPFSVIASIGTVSVVLGAYREIKAAILAFLRKTWLFSVILWPFTWLSGIFGAFFGWFLFIAAALIIILAAIFGYSVNSVPDVDNSCTGSGCDVVYVAKGDAVAMSMYTQDGYYMPIGIPAEGHITQYEGSALWFYLTLWLTNGHNGVDIAGDIGTPLYALGNGFAVYSYNGHSDSSYINGWYGCLAKVAYPGLDGEITNCYYAHMEPEVCAGKDIGKAYPVGMFTEVGKRGNTGASTWPHLHYECRKESSVYSITTSQFLGFSIPGQNMDKSKMPTVSLGIPSTADTGIAATKKYLGSGGSTDSLERKMGEWYKFLSSLSVVQEKGLDPLRIMASLYRERSSFLFETSFWPSWPSPYMWNPFQIWHNAAGTKRDDVIGCDSEQFGDFNNELNCYLKVSQSKANATQVSFQSNETPLASSVSPYYFWQYLFAYNGTYESPYWQQMHCEGKYNQDIAAGIGSNPTTKYTWASCGKNQSGYKPPMASRDFWYSSYVMSKVGYAWSNMPFRWHGIDGKPGAMAFYFLLLSWKAEDFTPPVPVDSGWGWGQVSGSSFSDSVK